MQSSNKKKDCWMFEFEHEKKKFIEPLMGWTGANETQTQVKMSFATKDAAIDYAMRHSIQYEVFEPHPRKKVKKSYADNFAYKPLN